LIDLSKEGLIMSPEEIRTILRRDPFVPFRICVSDRAYYDVRRPALVFVGNRETIIGITRNTESEFWDDPVIVSNIHITRLEPLIPETAST
jgi:hypothetical protein